MRSLATSIPLVSKLLERDKAVPVCRIVEFVAGIEHDLRREVVAQAIDVAGDFVGIVSVSAAARSLRLVSIYATYQLGMRWACAGLDAGIFSDETDIDNVDWLTSFSRELFAPV